MEKKCRFVLLFLCLCVLMFFPSSGGSHSGGLDSKGGHYNHKTGEYHYHRQSAPEQQSTTPGKAAEIYDRAPKSSYKSEIINSTSETEREKRINEYFRSANENVGALDCGVVIHARDVNEATKKGVKWGQGDKCIICGSTVKLEIDHRRALMNGGTNDISNLALLCDDCHKIKTKYDNSLRRKRESVCRRK